MKHTKVFLYASFVVIAILAMGVTYSQNAVLAQDEVGLVSLPVDEAPTLDGVADEAFWADAKTIEVELRRGANMEESVTTVQSVYTEDMVYFLVTWTDPTHSYLRFPWEMQEDGTWMQHKDPENMGGDENVWYEDKYSFIWSIDNSIVDFDYSGCFVACHTDDDSGKPYGNKFTESEGELGDIWHFKSVRNVGQVHDQYLDWTEYSEDTSSAGRHSDPSESGGYSNNVSEDGSMPAFMPAGEDFPRDGSPGFILAEEAVEFDASIFEPGDLVPGIVVAPFVGDGGDIDAGWVYEDGVWTLELGRALVTESEFDIQFEDLTETYWFGLAAFDNAQVRHAYQRGANSFVFGE
jgi:hypothetical protein